MVDCIEGAEFEGIAIMRDSSYNVEVGIVAERKSVIRMKRIISV